MRSHSQRMRIAEKLIEITNDLKDSYVKQYGSASDWDISFQDLYLLNCDAEILHYLQQEELAVHEDVYKIGISLGVLVIQKEIQRRHYNQYGDNVDHVLKEQMFEQIQRCIYDYAFNGVFDAY
jgi:hypothetical protein